MKRLLIYFLYLWVFTILLFHILPHKFTPTVSHFLFSFLVLFLLDPYPFENPQRRAMFEKVAVIFYIGVLVFAVVSVVSILVFPFLLALYYSWYPYNLIIMIPFLVISTFSGIYNILSQSRDEICSKIHCPEIEPERTIVAAFYKLIILLFVVGFYSILFFIFVFPFYYKS